MSVKNGQNIDVAKGNKANAKAGSVIMIVLALIALGALGYLIWMQHTELEYYKVWSL